MLDIIIARSNQYPMGRVPQAEVALLSSFAERRFFSILAWLVTGFFVEVEGGKEDGTIRLLPRQHFNAPYGYLPTTLYP